MIRSALIATSLALCMAGCASSSSPSLAGFSSANEQTQYMAADVALDILSVAVGQANMAGQIAPADYAKVQSLLMKAQAALVTVHAALSAATTAGSASAQVLAFLDAVAAAQQAAIAAKVPAVVVAAPALAASS